jgi:hypothetical protein
MGPRKTDYTQKILEYTQINATFLKKPGAPRGFAADEAIDTTTRTNCGPLRERHPVDPRPDSDR